MGGDKGRKGEERREEGKRKKGTYIYKMKRSSPIPNTHTHIYTYRLRTGVCCLNYTFRQKSCWHQLKTDPIYTYLHN